MTHNAAHRHPIVSTSVIGLAQVRGQVVDPFGWLSEHCLVFQNSLYIENDNVFYNLLLEYAAHCSFMRHNFD